MRPTSAPARYGGCMPTNRLIPVTTLCLLLATVAAAQGDGSHTIRPLRLLDTRPGASVTAISEASWIIYSSAPITGMPSPAYWGFPFQLSAPVLGGGKQITT